MDESVLKNKILIYVNKAMIFFKFISEFAIIPDLNVINLKGQLYQEGWTRQRGKGYLKVAGISGKTGISD